MSERRHTTVAQLERHRLLLKVGRVREEATFPVRRFTGSCERQSANGDGGSCLRLIDSCINQLKAHGPSRTPVTRRE